MMQPAQPDNGLSMPMQLDESAALRTTPCGDGKMVWRAWGEGLPLVLLHGGFGSWRHWIRNIGPLAEVAQVTAGDLPGLGDSNAAPQPHDAPSLGRIVANGVTRLFPDDEPLVLAGFSLGSVIAAHAAAHLGTRVRRLVLVGPSGLGAYWHDRPERLRRRPRDATPEMLRETVIHNLGASMLSDPASIDELAISVHTELIQQRRALKGLPISESSALLDVLPQLASRTHIVYGTDDCYAEPSAAAAGAHLKRVFPGLGLSFVPGAGHWVNFERADFMNRLITDEIVKARSPGPSRNAVSDELAAGGNQ